MVSVKKGEKVSTDSIWYDLFCPEQEEIKIVEQLFQIEIPTFEDMKEIELSSRLYLEEEVLFMTANLITKAEEDIPFLSPITFILNGKRLITVRFAEPRPFQIFIKKLEKNYRWAEDPPQIFINLLETIVDRMADILELIGTEVDTISKEIFQSRQSKKGKHQYELHDLLTRVGKKGDLSTKTRESLGTLNRLVKFYSTQVENHKFSQRLKTLQRDVLSISDHLFFLFNKITFLLEATLGFINIEQNDVIKIVSVAAVVFLPPTVIASIYGMNFKYMPELSWKLGFPYSLALMVISAILPYLYFKRKGWL